MSDKNNAAFEEMVGNEQTLTMRRVAFDHQGRELRNQIGRDKESSDADEHG